VPSGDLEPRGAESYLTVRRAPRGEKAPLGAVHRWPQQKAGEKCGLRPSGHPDRAEGGKRGQRSGIGAIPYREGGADLLECSPPARLRRAAGEVDATDERLRSEGAMTEAAWPRALPADGGRPGTETGTDAGTDAGAGSGPLGYFLR